MATKLVIFLCLSSIHFICHASRQIDNNDLTLLLHEFRQQQARAKASAYSDALNVDTIEGGVGTNDESHKNKKNHLSVPMTKHLRQATDTHQKLLQRMENDKKRNKLLTAINSGDFKIVLDKPNKEVEQKPKVFITHDEIGFCKGETTKNKIYECVNSDEYDQCPSFKCRHGNLDGDCKRTHPHPVTRSLEKNALNICTYVKHCDYPFETYGRPAYGQTREVISDLFRLHWDGRFFNSLKNVFNYEGHRLKTAVVQIGVVKTMKEKAEAFLHKLEHVLEVFAPIKEFASSKIAKVVPQEFRDYIFNGYMKIAEEMVKTYFVGGKLKAAEKSYHDQLIAESNPLFETPLLGAIAIRDHVIEFMYNAFEWAFGKLYDQFVKRPMAKNKGVNANNYVKSDYHAPKMDPYEDKTFRKKFAQAVFNTANDVMNNIADGVLMGVIDEYTMLFNDKLIELEKKINNPAKEFLNKIQEPSFASCLKELVGKFLKNSDKNVEDVINQYTILKQANNLAESVDNVKDNAVQSMKDLFAAAIYSMRIKMEVFFRNAVHSLDNRIRGIVNQLKSTYAAGLHLDYSAGMDLGLHVTPNCDPNRRMMMEPKFDKTIVEQMVQKDIGGMENLKKCPNKVTSWQIGNCMMKRRPVSLRYHCKRTPNYKYCPNYEHRRLHKKYGEKVDIVFINHMKASDDYAVCTYIKECVRRSDKITKGLIHAFEEEEKGVSKEIDFGMDLEKEENEMVGKEKMENKKLENENENVNVHKVEHDTVEGGHRTKREKSKTVI